MSVPEPGPTPSVPRAFAQGVGTVFQFAGVGLFIVVGSACCGSALLSGESARFDAPAGAGWHLPWDIAGSPTLSVPVMTTAAVFAGVVISLAIAAAGLGLQAQRRHAPTLAVGTSIIGGMIYALLAVFMLRQADSTPLAGVCLASSLGLGLLAGMAIGAYRDMAKNPPTGDVTDLPADYRAPWSHLHQDPPDVRLRRELEKHRQAIAESERRVKWIEAKLKRSGDDNDPAQPR